MNNNRRSLFAASTALLLGAVTLGSLAATPARAAFWGSGDGLQQAAAVLRVLAGLGRARVWDAR